MARVMSNWVSNAMLYIDQLHLGLHPVCGFMALALHKYFKECGNRELLYG